MQRKMDNKLKSTLNKQTITIITAVYNSATAIRDCLKSIGSQTVNCEHLIIDGASSDATLETIHLIAPSARIVSEPDNGIYDAMNKGLRLADGDVIGILNADDLYSHEKVLERVADAFADPSVDACYGDLVYVKEQETRNEKRGTRFKPQNPILQTQNFQVVRYWKSGPFHHDKFYWGWMPPHPTFFVRRRVYEKYGLFNLDLGSAADYEMMLRFLLKHRIKVAYIPEVLVKMRVGGVSNASIKNRMRANHKDRKAWEVNGLKPYPWTLCMKPLRKIPQWLQRPPKKQY
jgi:glycosyltransferase